MRSRFIKGNPKYNFRTRLVCFLLGVFIFILSVVIMLDVSHDDADHRRLFASAVMLPVCLWMTCVLFSVPYSIRFHLWPLECLEASLKTFRRFIQRCRRTGIHRVDK